MSPRSYFLCITPVRRNLLSSLISGFFYLAPPAYRGNRTGSAKAAHQRTKIPATLFLTTGLHFSQRFKNEARLGEGDSLYNDFSYAIVFSLRQVVFRTGLSTSATILAALIMDCRSPPGGLTDIGN